MEIEYNVSVCVRVCLEGGRGGFGADLSLWYAYALYTLYTAAFNLIPHTTLSSSTINIYKHKI